MTRWTILFLTTMFLLLGLRRSAQAQTLDTAITGSYYEVAYNRMGDSLVLQKNHKFTEYFNLNSADKTSIVFSANGFPVINKNEFEQGKWSVVGDTLIFVITHSYHCNKREKLKPTESFNYLIIQNNGVIILQSCADEYRKYYQF